MNDIEAVARAYLAAYDVESSNSEMWYRAVVDARDALRAALARETPTPPTPAEGRGEEDGSRGCIVRFCDDHAEVEIVPGPFCPVCSMALVLRDGVKLGRDARSIQHGDGGGKEDPRG